MKAQLTTFLVVLCLAYYCHSQNVRLYTKIQGKKANKTLYVNCTYTLDKKRNESLISMSMTKDNNQFYAYDNKTKSHVFPIPGINQLIFVDIGKVNIPNVSKKTSGMYKCIATTGTRTRTQTGLDQHYVGGDPAIALSLPLLAIALITFSVFK